MDAKLKMAKEFTPMQRQNSILKVIARIYKNITREMSTVFGGISAKTLPTNRECQKEVRVLTTWKYFK